MTEFNLKVPIKVRYSDLDPQGHVNNAVYLSFFEQARVEYIKRLGLWDGNSFQDIGIIIANAQVEFLKPIELDSDISVGISIRKMGTKSLKMEYSISDDGNNDVYATGSTVLVAYDYSARTSILIPEEWRKIISGFEGLTTGD